MAKRRSSSRKTRKANRRKKTSRSLTSSFKMIRKDIMKKLEKDMKANIKYSQKIFGEYLGQNNIPNEKVIRDMLLSMLTNKGVTQKGGALLTGFTPSFTASDHTSALPGDMPAGNYNEVVKAHQVYDHPSPPEAVCGGEPNVTIDSPANQVPVSNDGNFPGVNQPNLHMIGGQKMDDEEVPSYKNMMKKMRRTSQKGGALSMFPVQIDTNGRFPGITDPTDPILGFTSKVTQNIDAIQNMVDGEDVLNTDPANSGYMGLSDKSSTFAAKDIQMVNTPLVKVTNVEVEPDNVDVDTN
jgi:hypothetical protein